MCDYEKRIIMLGQDVLFGLNIITEHSDFVFFFLSNIPHDQRPNNQMHENRDCFVAKAINK